MGGARLRPPRPGHTLSTWYVYIRGRGDTKPPNLGNPGICSPGPNRDTGIASFASFIQCKSCIPDCIHLQVLQVYTVGGVKHRVNGHKGLFRSKNDARGTQNLHTELTILAFDLHKWNTLRVRQLTA